MRAAFIVLLLTLCSTGHAEPSASASLHVEQGDVLFSAGRFLEAAAEYKTALAIDPSPEIQQRIARAYEAGRAAAADPVTPPAPASLRVVEGDELFSTGRFAEAASAYKAAYAIDPSPEILERLARAYERAGDGGRAAAVRRVASDRVTPRIPPPRVVRDPRGNMLLRTGMGIFAGGYASAFLTANITYFASGDGDGIPGLQRGHEMLFIPLVGPLISLRDYADPGWVAPCVIFSAAQLSGLALAIAGGVVGRRTHRLPPVTVAPFSTPTAQGVSVSGTF